MVSHTRENALTNERADHQAQQEASTQAETESKAETQGNKKLMAYWLFFCCVMIYMMVVIGGVTRLTHSGLSMVEWKPILGVIPPITNAQWQVAFNKYKAYPEYKVRRGMSLGEFKRIFYVEYFHRIFGRLIGLVFFVPFLFFWLSKRIPQGFFPHLLGLFVLGGMQGVLGWYMVKSGLIDVPRVSPYRLTAHLSLACFLYGYTLWLALRLVNFTFQAKEEETQAAPQEAFASLRRWSIALTVVVSIMIMSGGFVAGNRAGFSFNTFPLMNGQLIPSGLFSMSPWFANFFENNLTVQFDHRMIAYLLCVLVPFIWWKGMQLKPTGGLRLSLHLLLAGLILQVTLGISTLLLMVPIALAAAHQAGALLVLTFSLMVAHQLKSSKSSAP